jgi:hypothetical protein
MPGFIADYLPMIHPNQFTWFGLDIHYMEHSIIQQTLLMESFDITEMTTWQGSQYLLPFFAGCYYPFHPISFPAERQKI